MVHLHPSDSVPPTLVGPPRADHDHEERQTRNGKEIEVPNTYAMRRSPGGQVLADLLGSLSARLRYADSNAA